MIYFSIAIISIMTIFLILGLVDLVVLKNKLGLGEETKRGFSFIGPLCLSLVGIISSVPLISYVCQNSICILYEKMGLDPSMFIASILANDMGGYQIATSITKNALIGKWAGGVYASMMGATIIFSIPVGLSNINKEDTTFFIKGILFGIASIPFGAFIGGLIIGIPVLSILLNLIIPFILSIIIIICLVLFPNGTCKVFKYLSLFINILSISFLSIAVVKDLILTPIANTGAFDISKVPFINKFNSTKDGIIVAGSIGLVLGGALPFVLTLNKLLRRPINYLSNKFNCSEYGISGYLLTSANNMAMFSNINKMNDKEKVYNVAFSVGGAFLIGDHLAFTASVDASIILPMMIAKLISGLLAVLFVFIYFKLLNTKFEKTDKNKNVL